MGKRRYRGSINYEKRIEEKVRQRRGQDHFDKYIGWIMPQDISSKGRTHELFFSRTGGERKHIFLSDLERDYFLHYDFLPETIEIREQFPMLDRDMTMIIAAELGIKHPVYSDRRTPVVMSTDLLIDYINTEGEYAQAVRSVKYAKDLASPRTIEKLAIEQEYFKRKFGIDNWSIITEKNISQQERYNLNSVYACLSLKDNHFYYGFIDSELEIMTEYFLKRYKKGTLSNQELFKRFESEWGLEAGAGRIMFKHLIVSKKIEIDLTKPIN